MLGNRRSILATSITCLALAVMVFSGCADFGDITGPERQSEALDQAKHEQPSIGPAAGLNWLQYTRTQGLAKTIPIKKNYVEGLFKPGEDLTLVLGKLPTISMKLEIDGNALKEETLISMSSKSGAVMMDLGIGGVFGPSGLKFRKPAKWTIESENIDVDPDEIDDLQCYCLNEAGEWEPIAGKAELVGDKLILICWIKHFSRYAWA